MDEQLAYFLDLRIRLRGRAEAVAIVDRCLAMIARAARASPEELVRLDAEVETLREDLAARFGRKHSVTYQ